MNVQILRTRTSFVLFYEQLFRTDNLIPWLYEHLFMNLSNCSGTPP